MIQGKNSILSILILSIGIILLGYLIYNLLSTITNYKEILKLLMIFILPIPIALFYAFATLSKNEPEHIETAKDKIISALILILTCAFLLLLIYQYDKYGRVTFKELRIIPIFINTMITFAYTVNFLVIRNLKLSGILSGLLLGMAIYFFI